MAQNQQDLALRNPVKEALKENRLQVGLWNSLCSNMAVEVLSYAGFDWMLFDMEHAPSDYADLLGQLQAIKGSPTVPMVRPPWNDMVTLKRLLDLGFYNFVIPFVQTAEEAKAAVSAVRYPPHGVRGVAAAMRASCYGYNRDYWSTINERISLIVQVETIEAAGRLDDICAVEGVDAVFIGPGDLAASMGHLMNPGADEVQAQMAKIAEVCNKNGMTAGILAFGAEDAKRYVEMGYRLVGVGSDVGLLKKGAAESLAAFADR